jgi:hypothetical protein
MISVTNLLPGILFPHSLLLWIFMPPENDTRLFDQLKARIEEYNQKDRQAVDRAKEERDKWLQTKSDAQEEDISNQ